MYPASPSMTAEIGSSPPQPCSSVGKAIVYRLQGQWFDSRSLLATSQCVFGQDSKLPLVGQDCKTVMATAASPKRMVSSVFITLASPYRATVTQQQPTLQAHSDPAGEKQHTAMRVGPSDSTHASGHKKDNHSPSDSYGSVDPKDWKHTGALARASDPQCPKPAQPRSNRGKQQEKNRELFPSPPPLPPSAARPSSLGRVLFEEPACPPPPPAQTALSYPLTPGQQPLYNREVETKTPASVSNQDERSHGVHRKSPDTSSNSREVCGFCRKPVALSEPVIEALNRTYHDGCFQCRSCHIPLAGKQYYNKAGIPLCEDCYQASLELCWFCGEVITDHVIRALERAYHLSCFTCTTCKQQIGEQAFAQGEVGEVYCLQDYYRKYAPNCSTCNQLIIPKEDGTDSYTVECLGRSYHENCYRCQVCFIQLSPEPNEHGCYPLDGKMLCKSCHLNLVSGQH
ncbi:filamin-binding LIM protein 1 isoform X2 [Channa argus]|uniref:filamin-binding LIM protein 1 isoform X2 n=1 Tax=Channa argus TaxID=215402 RepID=UPI00351FD6C8